MHLPNIIRQRTESTPVGDVIGSFVDQFTEELVPGSVVGSVTGGGVMRKGIDKEKVIGIDNGALRIQPLIKPGWGRAGVCYGPYERQNGLAFGAFLTNGHNISRAQALPDDFRARLRRWMVGSETESPLTRLRHWVRSRQKRFMWRRLRQWFRTGTRFYRIAEIEENLAVGWFPREAPADPLQEGNAHVVHANVPEGGEIWTRTGSNVLRASRGIQSVPVYYLVVLRERGAAYYAASMAGVAGLPALPMMRLVAIDAFSSDPTVYAGIHQSVLGEIGFRVDTRVHRTQVGALPEFAEWYGSAHGADTLTGDGPLEGAHAEVGGEWKANEGELRRTERGVVGMAASNEAMLELNSPAGLVHALIEVGDQPVDGIGVIWRGEDEDNSWCFEASSRRCQLSLKEEGRWSRFPAVEGFGLVPNSVNSLQVADDGESMRLYLNGDLVYGVALSDERLQGSTRVGIRITGGKGTAEIRSFEAHPRAIPIPGAFGFDGAWPTNGGRPAVIDRFEGDRADLSGHPASLGEAEWRRDVGKGSIQLTGKSSARVLGSAERPCPGRTAYTVDWCNPVFADVEVTITPPARREGARERGRGGLIFWEDSKNYITISLWHNEGEVFSTSSFFQVDGYEELYDAVWTNIGKRIRPGTPYNFRVVVDGRGYLAFIDGEPVLYRAFTDVYPDWSEFLIQRVGIVANWEWGTDTGSVFQDFVARDRA